MADLSRGDELAFERIVSVYHAGVARFLARRVRDPGRVDDLVQEVFLRVYRARGRYRPTASFRSWLFTIANRLSMNEERSRRRRVRVFRPLLMRAPHGDSGDDAVDDFWANVPDRTQETPGESAEKKELAGAIRNILEHLPPNQRTALELQAGLRFSYVEIAETMGVTAAAVRSLLVRARDHMKQGLERYFQRSGEVKP